MQISSVVTMDDNAAMVYKSLLTLFSPLRPFPHTRTQQSEIRKNKTKEEKKAIKEENARIIEEYGWAVVDGHKQKIGNFRIEPPGLFRGRGDHPKMGTLKKRVNPEDVSINCSKGAGVSMRFVS